MVWMGWFWLCNQIVRWQAVAVLPYATKWHAARSDAQLFSLVSAYEARVRFGTRVRVRVRDSAIFEKGEVGAGAAGLGD